MDLQPQCAQKCLSSAILAVGCSIGDLACACASSAQNAIGNSAAPCLLQNCPATQLVEIGSAGEAACSAYSVTFSFSQRTTTSIPSATSTGALNVDVGVRRLSTEVIIGISVGAGAVLGLILVGVCLCLRRRRHVRETEESLSETAFLNPRPSSHEQISELHGRGQQQELPAKRHSIYELAAETFRWGAGASRAGTGIVAGDGARRATGIGQDREEVEVVITPPTPIDTFNSARGSYGSRQARPIQRPVTIDEDREVKEFSRYESRDPWDMDSEDHGQWMEMESDRGTPEMDMIHRWRDGDPKDDTGRSFAARMQKRRGGRRDF